MGNWGYNRYKWSYELWAPTYNSFNRFLGPPCTSLENFQPSHFCSVGFLKDPSRSHWWHWCPPQRRRRKQSGSPITSGSYPARTTRPWMGYKHQVRTQNPDIFSESVAGIPMNQQVNWKTTHTPTRVSLVTDDFWGTIAFHSQEKNHSLHVPYVCLSLVGDFLRIGISWDSNHHFSSPFQGILFLSRKHLSNEKGARGCWE